MTSALEEIGTPGATPSSVVVIEHGRMPSTDYFVVPYVTRLGLPVTVFNSTRGEVDTSALSPGALVVFVRYIDGEWAEAVRTARGPLAGVVLFMDDDLLDWRALRGLPWRYAYKIWRLTLRRRQWLKDVKARLWVSREHLAGRYASLNPLVIAATLTAEMTLSRPAVRIAYHGTASHAAEIRWLVPIVRKVQEQCDNTFFEIFGRADVNRLYRGIERTAVLHPMSWPNYYAYTSLGGLDIGLAPLLPSRFNAGRSGTKFFDFVRCGAVGIYSDAVPYAGFVRNEVDGILVKNDSDAWVEAILRLARDDKTRKRMAKIATERASAQQ
jgi:glycosyltransferase involved in cell wall biosynthesis